MLRFIRQKKLFTWPRNLCHTEIISVNSCCGFSPCRPWFWSSIQYCAGKRAAKIKLKYLHNSEIPTIHLFLYLTLWRAVKPLNPLQCCLSWEMEAISTAGSKKSSAPNVLIRAKFFVNQSWKKTVKLANPGSKPELWISSSPLKMFCCSSEINTAE